MGGGGEKLGENVIRRAEPESGRRIPRKACTLLPPIIYDLRHNPQAISNPRVGSSIILSKLCDPHSRIRRGYFAAGLHDALILVAANEALLRDRAGGSGLSPLESEKFRRAVCSPESLLLYDLTAAPTVSRPVLSS